jgi:hypothetical protein
LLATDMIVVVSTHLTSQPFCARVMLRVIRPASYSSWTECPITTNIDAPDSLDVIDMQLPASENPSNFVGLVRGALPIRRSFSQKPYKYTLHRACIVGHTIENRRLLPPDCASSFLRVAVPHRD